MTIGLSHYLTLAAVLFTIGVFGIFLNRKNVIVILMSIELMLLAVNINMVAFSVHLGDLVGQVFAMLILTVAAAEAAIRRREEEIKEALKSAKVKEDEARNLEKQLQANATKEMELLEKERRGEGKHDEKGGRPAGDRRPARSFAN